MPDKTPNDASLQSTKQMLDELDALMEKMLTLPVSDLDEARGVSAADRARACAGARR